MVVLSWIDRNFCALLGTNEHEKIGVVLTGTPRSLPRMMIQTPPRTTLLSGLVLISFSCFSGTTETLFC